MKMIRFVLIALVGLAAACAQAVSGPPLPTALPSPSLSPMPSATTAPSPRAAPSATDQPAPTASPTRAPTLAAPTLAAPTLATPTVDTTITAIVDALLSTVQPRSLESFPSPDGQWRAEVLVYDCTNVVAGATDENAYDLLRVVNLTDGQVHNAADQLQNCGGVGAAGLGGIRWSPNSRYFYFTNAREGVPDGSGGMGWHRSFLRFDTRTAQTTSLGYGPFSPDGQRIAAIYHRPDQFCEPQALLAWNLDGQVLARFPFESAVENDCPIYHMAWNADGEELVTLETSGEQGARASSLYRVSVASGERQVLVQDHQPFFVEVSWPEPDRLRLTDQDYQPWVYSLSTGELSR